MADKTRIEWTEATWNPIRGCSRVSEGCRHCYAETMAARFSGPGHPYEGLTTDSRWNGTVRLVPEHLEDPLRWKRPRKVFVNSMSDLFHEALAFEDIAAIFGVMAAAPQHTFQVLTKRAGRMLEFFEWIKAKGDERNPFDKTRTTERMAALMAKFDWVNQEEKCGPWPLPNVWLGVSAEDQDTLRDRAWKLLKVPAAVRFVSLEPLLGAVDLDEPELLCRTWRRGATIGTYLDWVIVGGESGPHARPMNPDWVRSLRDQCATAEIPFLFKQWGEFCAPDQLPDPVFREWDAIENAAGHPDIDRPLRFGKKTTGRLLDGALHDGYPKPLTQASA